MVDDSDGQLARVPHKTYDTLLPELAELGYDGVEIPLKAILFYGKEKFKSLLKQTGLKVIVMAMTDGPVCPGTGILWGGPYPGFSAPATPGQSDKGAIVAAHLATFKEQVTAAQEFKPTFVNSHSCKDYLTQDMAREFFTEAVRWAKENNYEVHHESHRKRFLHSPWLTRDFLMGSKGSELDDLTMVADLSHWINVAETDCNDMDLTAVIEAMAPRFRHIHMRVGYDHGPQVPDPRAPKWLPYTEGHERWWDAIHKAAEARGDTEVTVTTEFGPPNYQICALDNTPLADIWDVNHWIALRRQERFAKLFGKDNTSSLKPSSTQTGMPTTNPGESVLKGRKLGVDVSFV